MVATPDSLPLIRTKLYQPRITGELVPRPRLLQRLEERRGRPLTLVCAPAGYGMTTLVSSWLDRDSSVHRRGAALFLRPRLHDLISRLMWYFRDYYHHYRCWSLLYFRYDRD